MSVAGYVKEAESGVWLDLGLRTRAFYAAPQHVTSTRRRGRRGWTSGRAEERKGGRSSRVGWGCPALASQACHSCV